MRDKLQSVADAEHGHCHVKNARIGGRSVTVIDRTRAAGKNDPDGRITLNLIERCRARQYYGENFQFADAPGDELRILRAEIEDDNGLMSSFLRCFGGCAFRRGMGFGRHKQVCQKFILSAIASRSRDCTTISAKQETEYRVTTKKLGFRINSGGIMKYAIR